MTLESTQTSIETTLQFLLECGSVQLKIMPLDSSITWEGFIERQTTLEEYYEQILPAYHRQVGPPEITIHLNAKVLKDKEDLGQAIHEMCEYILTINSKGWCQ